MKVKTCWGMLAIAMWSGFMSFAGAEIIQDNFDSLNTGTWNDRQSSLGTAPSFSSGAMTVSAGPGGGHKSILLSNSTLINPFTAALSVTFSGLMLSGNEGTGNVNNSFYAIVGRQEADVPDQYKYDRTLYDADGGALGFRLDVNGTGYQLRVDDWGNGAGTAAVGQYNLDAMPTDIIWTIDGETGSWGLEVVGATLTGFGVTPGVSGTSDTGTFQYFKAAEFTESDVSRLAFGALSTGSDTTGASAAAVTIDGLAVAAVPEPATIGMLGVGCVTVMALRRQLTK